MTIKMTNDHRQFFFNGAVCITHWQRSDRGGSVASPASNATHLEMEGQGRWPTLTFILPDQEQDFERVMVMLEHAFNGGIEQNKKDVRVMFKKLIGIDH